MAEYHYQNITLPLDKDGELYKRAEVQAHRYGVTVERMLETAVFMGLNRHIEVNIAFYERHNPPAEPEADKADAGGAEA